MFRSYHYTLSQHDFDRPWIVVSSTRHLTVSLADDQNFFDWAAKEWSEPRFNVELDPGGASPDFEY